MKSVLVGAAVLTFLLVIGAPAPAPAQLGVVNPFALPPGSPATPFGPSPHPFNNAHPVQPWSGWNRVVGEFMIGARVVVVPMAGSSSVGGTPMVGWQTLMLPGYQVTETSSGYIVHQHWGVEPMGSVYYWAWRPTYYVTK